MSAQQKATNEYPREAAEATESAMEGNQDYDIETFAAESDDQDDDARPGIEEDLIRPHIHCSKGTGIHHYWSLFTDILVTRRIRR